MRKVNVGIDLGTTYSAVAVSDADSGEVGILKHDFGNSYTPSVVCIDNGSTLIGEEAKQELLSGNLNTAAFYKSFMGDEFYSLYLDGEEYSPEKLSEIFLRELKRKIEKENDVKIDNAVITVPAYFMERQRRATMRAGARAGLKVVGIINEPTAAIIAYGLTGKGKRNVLVYDLGGGTFDVTIASIDGMRVDVLATNGNHQLGGKNWDHEIVCELIDRFRDEFGIDIFEYPEDFKKLTVTAEEVKKRLTKMPAAMATVSCEGYVGRYEITRSLFEERTSSLLNTTAILIEQCFDEIGGGFGWHSLDEVVLVGGSTRMPQVKEYVTREYGKPPVTKNIDVDTIVASGAAIWAHLITQPALPVIPYREEPDGCEEGLLLHSSDISDITGHALGMLAFNKDGKVINSVIVPKNSKKGQPFGKNYTFSGDKLNVYVLQGSEENPYDHEKILYKYVITGMKGGAKTALTVDFLYNDNGMVEVNARTDDGEKLVSTQTDVTETIAEVIAALEKERKDAEDAARRAKHNKPLEVMFMLDVSGSMCSPLAKAIEAIRGFVHELEPVKAKISILLFADRCGYTCYATRDKREIEKGINEIQPAFDRNDYGWGNCATPINTKGEDFSDNKSKRIIVVLTDGVWNHQASEIRAAERLKNNGTVIHAIGFGGADEKFLNKLSSGNAGKLVDLNTLDTALREVASSIATEA